MYSLIQLVRLQLGAAMHMMLVQPTLEPPREMGISHQHPSPWESGEWYSRQARSEENETQDGSVTVSEQSSHLIDGVGVR